MNFRDVELLSSYLDGQTSPSDSTRLESRLKTDPALASALGALRESRTLLRRLPKRRAPRNFLLTPKMVGQKPPLPRSYPVFRFATALATILFALSFVANQTSQLAASAPAAYGIGGGGGDTYATQPPATQPPMVESAPAATQPPAPEPTMFTALNAPTATPEAVQDQNRIAEEPVSPKTAGEPVPASAPFHIPLMWQIGLGVIALLGAGFMFLIQRLAANKWRGK
jgi:hypothetical protein